MQDTVIILDFGSQYNQLIARRIREMGVYAEILPFHTPLSDLRKHSPVGIILSGGPSSVYEEGAPTISPEIYEMGLPILGICYGMQLMVQQLGGRVVSSDIREFGKASLKLNGSSPLTESLEQESQAWMSHGDSVSKLPQGFELLGVSDSAKAIIGRSEKHFYGVQFHPEVSHTIEGTALLNNFVFKVCQAKATWSMSSYIDSTIDSIRKRVGDQHVMMGLSGGVDSSVAATLIQRAIGDQLTCIFVDTGLLRKNEAEQVMSTYGEHFKMNIVCVDASARFMEKLKGVTDPEEKRKKIGAEFVAVFQEESEKIPNASFLGQGTIYPDVIESQSVKGPSATIKSHHNVGGLPDDMDLKLLEPLRELFKDEVRKVGRELGIPAEMVDRHPFPGPGLGIRILGEVSSEKADILRLADAIFIEELRRSGDYQKVSQAFVALLPVKSVGVMGDQRTYEFTAVVRSVNTEDFMTATWSRLSYDLLDTVSRRIINEVRGINRVTYDISSKPPATVEWE